MKHWKNKLKQIMFLPAPSKGWCLNPKGSLSGTLTIHLAPLGGCWFPFLVPEIIPWVLIATTSSNSLLPYYRDHLQTDPSETTRHTHPFTIHEARAPIRDLILHGRRNLWGSRGGLGETRKKRGRFGRILTSLNQRGSTVRDLLHGKIGTLKIDR